MKAKTETKKCSKCGEVKALGEFHNEKSAKSGKRSACNKCEIKRSVK